MIAAGLNILLNYVLILILDDAMGAAIATAVTFLISWILATVQGIKLSNIKINLKKQILVFGILVSQSVVIVLYQNMLWSFLLLVIIIIMNWNNIIFLKNKVNDYLHKN